MFSISYEKLLNSLKSKKSSCRWNIGFGEGRLKLHLIERHRFAAMRLLAERRLFIEFALDQAPPGMNGEATAINQDIS